ncbi:MAG: polysaccharide deacetylase family protein [Candidatus Lokiarchaeota archaeon]|nr:polysaccharide deacetylase family protein [Candidatus Harpocratesius repetitus]
MPSIIDKLGFSQTDKVVILHLDDLGISHSANQAVIDIFSQNRIHSGSIIANSPWMPELVQNIKDLSQKIQLDIGVHLTFTSEYKNFRWRPIATNDPQTGLVDIQGFLWQNLKDAVANVVPKYGELEMRAQIDALQKLGLELTHMDTHMFSACHPKFLPILVKLAKEYRIPAMIPNMSKQMFEYMGLDGDIELYHKQLSLLQQQGYPIVENFKFASLQSVKNKLRAYRSLLKSIGPGLTHIFFHPAIYNDELKGITPETAVGRFQDYEVLMNHEFYKLLEKFGIQVYTYRELSRYFLSIVKNLEWKPLEQISIN